MNEHVRESQGGREYEKSLIIQTLDLLFSERWKVR